jgi:hypothetical protein
MVIKGKNGLALCMWRMGIRLEGMNSYPMLILTGNGTLQLHIIEMPPVIHDAKEAVCKTFGMTNPPEVFVERPRGFLALRYLLEQVKPTSLFNSSYIPHSAIIPSRSDNKVCLCLEPTGEFLHIGLVIETTRLAIGKVHKNADEISSTISLVALVAREYCCGQKPAVLAALIRSLSLLLGKVEVETLDL